MAKRPDLTKAERDKIVTLYQDGASGSSVAKTCGVSENTVWRWARRAGVIRENKMARRMVTPRRPANWMTSTVKDEIQRRFGAGEKVLPIANSLGLSYGHVAQLLAQSGSTRHLKISGTQLDDAVSAYENGATPPELAKKYGVDRAYMLVLLRKAGARMRSIKDAAQIKRGKPSPKRSFTAAQELEVCHLYKSGLTQRAVARHFNVSTATIAEARKRHGVPTRKAMPPLGMGKYADGRSRRFRSSWERAFAAYLDSKLIEWDYEPKSFQLKSGKFYLPDFYVPDWGAYVEVKGFSWKDSLQKVSDFREEYPEERLLLINRNALPLYGIKISAHNQSAEFTPPTS